MCDLIDTCYRRVPGRRRPAAPLQQLHSQLRLSYHGHRGVDCRHYHVYHCRRHLLAPTAQALKLIQSLATLRRTDEHCAFCSSGTDLNRQTLAVDDCIVRRYMSCSALINLFAYETGAVHYFDMSSL